MQIIESGNVAAALGVKLARAQVIAAFPITPQTPLTEKLSELIESGEMKAEYIPVESEHSALSVCIGAATAGARTFTATSANGLLYMHEQLHWAAGARLPIVMCVVNRGVGAPWNVWNDHQDSISQRDTGWIQIYVNDHQQIIDTVIKAFCIAEKVNIPVMVCYDGYILSHTYMPFYLPDQELVDCFLPPHKSVYALDPEDPRNINTVTLPEARVNVHGVLAHGYMELRYLLQEDLRKSIHTIAEVEERYSEVFNREGGAYLEEYRCRDASYIAVSMGSLSFQLRVAVDALREKGIRIGVAGVRLYRPFPDKAISNALSHANGIIVFEKGMSYGYMGPLASDIKSALYGNVNGNRKLPFVHNYILGLGGRNIRTRDLIDALRNSCKEGESTHMSDTLKWSGLKI
nr:pyruvate ferredoxin oxidoreductase [Desulfobacterales bacterium]